MARKNPFANVMNEPKVDNGVALDYTVKGASRSIMSTIDELAERADRLLEGETIIELDTDIVDVSFVRDRMEEDKQAFADLVAAITEQGQQTPILVRPHPKDAGRYMVVFGHRRLKVAKHLGRKVRAVVKEMADRDHVIAQGQENSARADLSFIEKAMFAKQLGSLNYDNDSATVMTALSIDRATLSKMLTVANMPEDILSAIGGAQSPGRDRWYELKRLIENPKKLAHLRDVLANTDISDINGDARFAFVIDALTRTKPNGYAREPRLSKWSPRDRALSKAVSADIRHDTKKFTLSLKSVDAVGFGQYIENQLDELYAAYRKQSKKG